MVLGFFIELKAVLERTPVDRNGSTHSDFPINSKTKEISSPVPPNPPKSGDIKALIIPKSALSCQILLSKPSGKLALK